jgi:hypothetical protein
MEDSSLAILFEFFIQIHIESAEKQKNINKFSDFKIGTIITKIRMKYLALNLSGRFCFRI